MKILFDNIIFSKENQGGVSNYWYEITTPFLKSNDNVAIFYEEENAEKNFCRQKMPIAKNAIIDHKSPLSSLHARLSAVRYYSNEFFLYHSSFYRSLKGSSNYAEVTTVHDFTHNYYATFLKKTLHNHLKYSAIKRSKAIICVSENTLIDLKKFCGKYLNGKTIEVIYNGVSDDYAKMDVFHAADQEWIDHHHIREKDFFLFVGSRAEYKNFDFVVHLLKNFPDKKLVVVGKPFTQKEILFIGQELMKRIVCLSNVPNEKLNCLYNLAYALLYPSYYEGFGIPIIEAMRAACPVIALNRSSIPEVAGDGAILIDNLFLDDFKKAVNKLSEANYREELIAKGLSQSEKFSWKKCAAQTKDFYTSINNQ